MSYSPIQRAYTLAYEFLKSLKHSITPQGYTLAFYPEGPDAIFIKNPSIVEDWFLNVVERHGRRAVRITPDNFNRLFPPPGPEQLRLDLEGRTK